MNIGGNNTSILSYPMQAAKNRCTAVKIRNYSSKDVVYLFPTH